MKYKLLIDQALLKP
jgi:hypothetical protein